MEDRTRPGLVDKTTTAADAIVITMREMMHEPGRFVPRVDFIIARGYLDGAPEARERAGARPWRGLTSKALVGFDDSTHELTLLAVLDGLNIDGVIGEMSVEPSVDARVERLSPPSARAIEFLRDHIAPGRTVIGRTAKS